ncbi:MAG: YwmB family TATA-box binding protein [Lachnospiraceae bacterium]|nr:YwmB family TATA-box binding protein [Lachnospiraceae bacterium]
MKFKFRAAVTVAVVFWTVVFVQIAVTRLYMSKTGFTQAFARNQLVVTKENTDSRNTQEGNTCIEGRVLGKMVKEDMAELAEELFRSMGGSRVLDSSMDTYGNYYVAYGYTSGIANTKNVNGKNINLNVAMSYNEEENCTEIIMGTPLINSDF